MAVLSVYQPRDRKASPLWQIFNRCYQAFEDVYDEKFEKRFGFLLAVIGESVRAFLKCGDLKQGFARIRCPNCGHEQILSFSCKKRCICGFCMAKRAVVFGHHLNENVFYPVPHRQYVFSIPIMLRIYFKYDRSLLTGLCQCAYRSLLTFLREVVGLKNGVPGVVMDIHTFGEYPDKFHPHLHAIVTDGLSRDTDPTLRLTATTCLIFYYHSLHGAHPMFLISECFGKTLAQINWISTSKVFSAKKTQKITYKVLTLQF